MQEKVLDVSEPLFSIVIACYNNEKFVREAVESALWQPYPSKEIIAVDDASKDATGEILRSFGKSVLFEGLTANGGAAAARNHGVSVANGRYIVFLDGDDVLAPWSLTAYARMIENRKPTLIFGKSLQFDGDVPKMTGGVPRSVEFVEYETFLDKDRPWVYNTSSLVVERAAFQRAGGWSPEIFYQDIQDLLNKLSISGKTELVIAPDTVFYRMHSTNAVRKVAPFIDGIYKLLAKAEQGAYPGERSIQRKRAAWFGGLILYWGKAGLSGGLVEDGFKLLIRHRWMVFIACARRILALVGGRKPIQVLALQPDVLEEPEVSDSAHKLAESISSK